MELLTQKEFAARMNVSRAYICKLVKQQRLPTVLTEKGPRIDPVAGERAMKAGRDPAKVAANALAQAAEPVEEAAADLAPVSGGGEPAGAGAPGAKGAPGYLVSRAERERIAAEMARIDLEERGGALVRRMEVAQVAGETARGLRDALLALPPKLGPMFASETDEHVISARLGREIADCMRDYARRVREGLGDGIGDPMGEA